MVVIHVNSVPVFSCRAPFSSPSSSLSCPMSSQMQSGPMKRGLEAPAPEPKKSHEESPEVVSAPPLQPCPTLHIIAHLILPLTKRSGCSAARPQRD